MDPYGGECWPLPFAWIWPQTKGKRNTLQTSLYSASAPGGKGKGRVRGLKIWARGLMGLNYRAELFLFRRVLRVCQWGVAGMMKAKRDTVPPDGTTPTRQGESAPWMTDAVHHLFRLQGLVVEDEGDTSADHLQPPSAVEDGAALPRNGHWGGGERENRQSTFSCFRCILWIEVCR